MTPSDAKLIHDAFAEESGSEPNYRVHERAYHEYLSYGYTVADLRMVMQYLKAENRKMTGAKHSLRLDRLLDFDFRRFDSLLNCAKAQHRNRIQKPTPRQEILTAFCRTEPEPKGACVPSSEVIAKLRQCL